MVVDSLSRKMEGSLIENVCLRMTVVCSLLDIIKKAQVDCLKKENWKIECIWGQFPLLFEMVGGY